MESRGVPAELHQLRTGDPVREETRAQGELPGGSPSPSSDIDDEGGNLDGREDRAHVRTVEGPNFGDEGGGGEGRPC